jgi:hypothetical protein
LIDGHEDAFAAPDPKKALMRLLASGSGTQETSAEPVKPPTPEQNSSRNFQLFLRWLIAGKKDNSLLADYRSCGRIARKELPDGTRLKKDGRRVSHPDITRPGDPMTKDTIALIEEGYGRHKKTGRSRTDVYYRTLETHFGCKVITSKEGRKITRKVVAPLGVAFPSKQQFYYHVDIFRGKAALKRDKVGAKKFDSFFATSEGRYRDRLIFLGERVECDATQIDEEPVSAIDRRTKLKPIWESRVIDVTTGDVLGIGFALSESSSAYRMARFCAAVDKQWYCGLFGYDLLPGAWDATGVWTGSIYDRGSAPMSEKVQEADLQRDGDSQEFVKKGRGKSKPSVEASHEKPVRGDDGSPIRRLASRTIHEICRHRLSRTVMQRASSDRSESLDPELLAAGVTPNPRGLREYCEQTGRSLLKHVTRAEAIRKYADRVDVKVTENCVEYLGDRYYSTSLKESGLLAQAKGGSRTRTGYAFEMIVSTLWLDLPGQPEPMELKLLPPRPDSEEVYDGWSNADRAHRDQLQSKARAKLREEQDVAKFDHNSFSTAQEQEAIRAKRDVKSDPGAAAMEAATRAGGRPARKAA